MDLGHGDTYVCHNKLEAFIHRRVLVCQKKNRIWLGSKIKMLDVNNGRQDRVLYTKHLVVQQAIVDHKKGTISYKLR